MKRKNQRRRLLQERAEKRDARTARLTERINRAEAAIDRALEIMRWRDHELTRRNVNAAG